MSYSTYAPAVKVPEGFPELLAELTTEILREQPQDAMRIYKFCYEFFLKKQEEGKGNQEQQSPETN